MRGIVHAFSVALVSTAIVSGAGTATAQESPAESWRPLAVAWQPCPEDATVDCGTLRVPIDWAKPRGEQFDLAVARRKATDSAHRLGVMLINPGGPGGSGVDFAIGANEALSRKPAGYPADQPEFEALLAYNEALRQDCRSHSGSIFDHAGTLDVIQDVMRSGSRSANRRSTTTVSRTVR